MNLNHASDYITKRNRDRRTDNFLSSVGTLVIVLAIAIITLHYFGVTEYLISLIK